MSFYATTSFFVAVLIYNLSFIIFLGSKEHSPRAFSFAVLLAATWVLSAAFEYTFAGLPSMGMTFGFNNSDLTTFFVRLAYFFGTVVPFAVFYFALTYPTNHKPAYLVRIILFFGGFLTVCLYFAKDILFLFGLGDLIPEHTLITKTYIQDGYLHWVFGKFDIFFFILFFGVFYSALAVLWQKYMQQTDPKLKKQAWWMFWAMTIGIIPVSILDAITPSFDIFGLYWIGIVSSLGWVLTVGYSIIKENQMNVRTVTNELLVVAMILLMFIGMFAV